ncbi:hypothetical protein [Saccharothrix coeruleofusca]|nr:hypothetical protein [Saccharothrix coeruleofusca]
MVAGLVRPTTGEMEVFGTPRGAAATRTPRSWRTMA